MHGQEGIVAICLTETNIATIGCFTKDDINIILQEL